MGIAFRSILRFGQQDLDMTAAKKIVEQWLIGKGWSQLTEANPSEIRAESSLVFTSIESPHVARRWLLSEVWDKPSWAEREETESRTSLSLIKRNDEVWLWLEIDTPTIKFSDSRTGRLFAEPQFAQTPTVLDKFLLLNKAFDGLVPVASQPLVIGTRKQVEELVSSLLPDPSRIGAIYVSTPPHLTRTETWKTQLNRMLFRSRGMGYTYVLTPDVLEHFNEKVGPGLRIHEGSIRTFLPGVQIVDEADSQRHRRLTFSTLSSIDPSKAGRMLRSVQVSRIRSVNLPSFFLDVERAIVRASRMPVHGNGTAVQGYVSDSEYNLLREVAEIYEQDLEIQKARNRELRDQYETLWLEHAELSGLLDKFESQKNYLEKKVLKLSPTEAFEEAPFESKPESWGELIEGIASLAGLRFVGSSEVVQDLERYEISFSALSKAWNGLKTLSSYSQLKVAGIFSGSIDDFVKDTSHGGFSSIASIKWESESVESNPRFRSQRMISVPAAVDSNLRVMCKAHITLSRVPPAPTMYFFDAVDKDGHVYIGHLGAHLDNTMTN
jgi:hypothetical protein